MPSLMQAAFVTASPYGWMVKRWRSYGDVFSSRFPIFGRVVYVADPARVKASSPATPPSSTPARPTLWPSATRSASTRS